ncbi:hypothetical protein D3C81_1502540 [compost metagenome]
MACNVPPCIVAIAVDHITACIDNLYHVTMTVIQIIIIFCCRFVFLNQKSVASDIGGLLYDAAAAQLLFCDHLTIEIVVHLSTCASITLQIAKSIRIVFKAGRTAPLSYGC